MQKDRLKPVELHNLADLLKSQTNFTLVELHGFLTAIASSPITLHPSDWLPVILEDKIGSKKSSEILTCTLKFYDQVLNDLEEGTLEPLLSYDDDNTWLKDVGSRALSIWCIGYIDGMSFYDDVWEEDVPEDNTLHATILFTLGLFSTDDDLLIRDLRLEEGKQELEAKRREILPTFPRLLIAFYSNAQKKMEKEGLLRNMRK